MEPHTVESRVVCALGLAQRCGPAEGHGCVHAAAHKLERAGCIALPARRGPSVNARRNLHIAPVAAPEAPIRCALCELQPLGVRIPKPATPDERFVQVLLAHEHSLGARNCVGENIRYLVRGWFAFIGWERSTRQRNLQHLTNNTRFLITRWGRARTSRAMCSDSSPGASAHPPPPT